MNQLTVTASLIAERVAQLLKKSGAI